MGVCRDTVFELGLDPGCLEVLEAFRGGDESWAGQPLGFDQLEQRARRFASSLAQDIADTLDGEIDADQAEMFSRRYLALLDLLEQLAEQSGEARILRVGAARRMAEILEADKPRALRVRALVDFYTSHAALLHHRQRLADTEPPSIEQLADGLDWAEAVPGLEHALIEGESELGPVHINLLRAANARLQALDCRRMARGAGRSFVQQVVRADAMAAISGGFFLYSEPDIEPPSRRTDPVGMLLADGELHNPPVFHRATLTQDIEGLASVTTMSLVGTTITWRDGSRSTVATSNSLAQLGVQPAAFNRAWGEQCPDHEGPSVAIVGDRIIALEQGALAIPLAGFVLCLPPADTRRPAYTPGAKLRYELPPAPSGQPLHNAVAGGPMLVSSGRIEIDLRAEDFVGTAPPATFSGDETFDHNLLPRMAVGLDEEGRLLMAAVDGRNFHRAPGFTLGATARLMQALGCVDAMNLDGGSSKRMVLRGEVLDLPTTELVARPLSEDDYHDAPVRPVHSAILLYYRTEQEDEDEVEGEDTEQDETTDPPADSDPGEAGAQD